MRHAPVELGSVLDEYADQGVTVHRDLDAVRVREQSRLRWTSEPVPLLSAVAEAGEILRSNPNAELADKLITPTPVIGRDVGALTLTRIINASIEPITEATSRSVVCEKAHEVNVCDSAETYFADVIKALRTKNPAEGGCELITDDDGQVILIRKGIGEPSALSLHELVVNGIPYPPGSLFSLHAVGDYNKRRGWELPKDFLPDRIHIFGSERVAKLGFMRLSAYALKDRGVRKAFLGLPDYESNLNTVLRATPTEIARYARAYIDSSEAATRGK